ncbi:tRNA (mnm(5)s(2)U34)-methyltransferase [Periweissella fabalis]|uniref:Methyltransferase domain-containing protein n=1 Tax=Periweissella fabalis TaxID=1070421 RepID=A0A7X6N5W3_9LACO|nr:class I SAM-dependent methyltransferase [Periweissella fabalis]MCM0598916.1 methyltransferase domain-containing protein [Periweissella fabalis]NKZ24578.1 methyltransferase domain-containing protein [Periweissella fabalis]
MKLANALTYSHTLLAATVERGDYVIDATVGNGHDTEFLSQLVGPKGHVLGFDVQVAAINSATTRLKDDGITNTELILAGHENVTQYLPANQTVGGAIFNLGYLPGADKDVITQGETTLAAINGMLPHLKKNGLIVLVVYYGHPGGQDEVNQLLNFAQALPQKAYHVLQYQFINQVNQPPYIIAIQKR